MRVIQFVPTLESGGVEKGVLEIAKVLVQEGHESHVVSAGGRLVDDLIISGSLHHHWNIHKKSILTLRLVKPLRKWILSMNADVLHIRSRMPAWIVWKAINGIPVKQRPSLISTVHGLHSVNFYSAVMTKPDNIIAVSESSKSYIVENYTKSLKKNINLIYRGVDDSDYFMGYKPSQDWLTRWHKDFPQTLNSNLLTIAGRISPLKDFDKILNLAKSVKSYSTHPIKILIAGEAKDKHSKYLRNLKETVTKLGLENDVYFLNFRSDIKNIYAISSIVFNTSNKPESFGRSILEPLSLGIPSIGYSRGGVKEILDELYPFGAVSAYSEEELFNKTIMILDGKSPPIKKNTKFLTSKMCRQTLDLYKEISVC